MLLHDMPELFIKMININMRCIEILVIAGW